MKLNSSILFLMTSVACAGGLHHNKITLTKNHTVTDAPRQSTSHFKVQSTARHTFPHSSHNYLSKNKISLTHFQTQRKLNRKSPLSVIDSGEVILDKESSGYQVKLKLIDHPLTYWLVHKKCDEPRSNNMIGQILSQKLTGSLVIDGGAFLGDTTLFMAAILKETNPGVKVLAVDPDPYNMEFLELMAKHNNLDNIITVVGALGNENKKVKIISHGNNHPSGNHIDTSKDTEKNTTMMYTLDHLLDEAGESHSNVAFIHYDLEGWELEALQGSPSILKSSAPFIMAELNNSGYSSVSAAYKNNSKSKVEDLRKKYTEDLLMSYGYHTTHTFTQFNENHNVVFAKNNSIDSFEANTSTCTPYSGKHTNRPKYEDFTWLD